MSSFPLQVKQTMLTNGPIQVSPVRKSNSLEQALLPEKLNRSATIASVSIVEYTSIRWNQARLKAADEQTGFLGMN
ncbi:hypothetical protein [Spirosoma aerolatum]|uniref:hypothetical protein n=1 Tax=Spirosoma aerolatum TaxID=1211326 RepID=UPI0009AEA133|nr:hypothetical protein [Spirosoma aerolatum]